MISPTDYARKWATRTAGASEDVKRGVMGVTEAPGQAAVRAKDALRANFLRALDDGTWERNTAAVSVDSWRQSMLGKGINHMQDGVNGAQSKVAAFAQSFLPFLANVVANVKQSTPRGSLEQNIQRSVAVMRGLAQYKRGLTGQ